MTILDTIDDTLAQRCACGCGRSLDSSPSAWYATEECQRRYLSAQVADADDVYHRPDAGGFEWPAGTDVSRMVRDETHRWTVLIDPSLVVTGPVDDETRRQLLDAYTASCRNRQPTAIVDPYADNEPRQRFLGRPVIVDHRHSNALTIADIQQWSERFGLALDPRQADVIRRLYGVPDEPVG